MGSLPHVIEDCLGVVQVFSDGSILRSSQIDFPFVFDKDDTSVIWKDVLFDKPNNLHLRLYKPPTITTTTTATADTRLPIIYFIHGGGFCLGSRTWPNIHNCCIRLSSGLRAIVVAPDYRLAPEHRLPAAIDDVGSALKWLQREALSEKSDEWLSGDVDYERVFVVGDSSGGNIGHHLAVVLGSGSVGLSPVRVRGYVLMAPFFGGSVRTKSEAEGPGETFLNLEILDRFWRLSLPVGETTDHPLVNPFGPRSRSLEEVVLDPILVVVGSCEIMKDRIEDYAKRLEWLGKNVEYVEFYGKQHGFFTNDPYSEVSNEVIQVLDRFMIENST